VPLRCQTCCGDRADVPEAEHTDSAVHCEANLAALCDSFMNEDE